MIYKEHRGLTERFPQPESSSAADREEAPCGVGLGRDLGDTGGAAPRPWGLLATGSNLCSLHVLFSSFCKQASEDDACTAFPTAWPQGLDDTV